MKKLTIIIISLVFLTSCASFLPQSGPSKPEIYLSAADVKSESIEPFLTIVELNPKQSALLETENKINLSDFTAPRYSPCLGKGDVVEIIIQEQYPPVLFLSKETSTYVVPAQVVTEEGINVPYVGKIQVEGKTTMQETYN
ncbi:hypothetical protein V4D30_05230 [Thermodesulfovibrio sp. 3907-1M]|uniref:Lipoprotein n=1 Tax=Thermodesulfovibrio autotrophicus TaxID=3118333 RepID=A0AAU8GVR6_9BACT